MTASSQFISIFIFYKNLPHAQLLGPMSAFCRPHFFNKLSRKLHNSLSVLLMLSHTKHRFCLDGITASNYFYFCHIARKLAKNLNALISFNYY